MLDGNEFYENGDLVGEDWDVGQSNEFGHSAGANKSSNYNNELNECGSP
jgi:hypothetical protein